jgi:hypothetical protein
MMTHEEQFFAEYAKQLTLAIEQHPNEYGYPASEAPFVVARMRAAVNRGSFNKDGLGFKWTCKALGIKYTYAAINAFLMEEVKS